MASSTQLTRIFITGGSGFVGSAVIRELLATGFGVNALVNRRPTSDARVRSVPGGLFDDSALDAGMDGCDAVVHLVGIIEEWPREGVTFERMHVEATDRVLAAASRRGVQRFVHMSALGTRPGAASRYHQTKWAAEERVRASGLDWTILRPSMIHGPEGAFMRMVAGWARRRRPPYLFMPYFGRGALGLGGARLLQPVYVEDVARAFVDALGRPQAIHQTYELGGEDVLTWPAFYRQASAAIVGRPPPAVPVPAWYAKALTRVVPPAWLPFNAEQVLMSQEDNVGDVTPFARDFGWRPRGFRQTIPLYAGLL